MAMTPLFLNYFLIAPGEAFFMGANEPRAYVAGEIIECAVSSDDVVSSGPTFSMGGPIIDAGYSCMGDRALRYTPPVPEFEVVVVTVEPGATLLVPLPVDIPAVFITLDGTGVVFSNRAKPRLVRREGDTRRATLRLEGGRELKQGVCLLAPADMTYMTLTVTLKQNGPLRIALAHRNQSKSSENRSDADERSVLDDRNYYTSKCARDSREKKTPLPQVPQVRKRSTSMTASQGYTSGVSPMDPSLVNIPGAFAFKRRESGYRFSGGIFDLNFCC